MDSDAVSSSPSPPRGAPRDRRALQRAVLGLVPGVKTMVFEDVRRGAPSAGLGLGLGLALSVVLVGWTARSHAIPRLRLVPEIELLDLGAAMLLAVAYEGLRLAHDLEERTRRPWAPRIVAALAGPAALGAILLPSVVRLAPRALEPAWWGSLLVSVGTAPAVVWCLLEGRLLTRAARRRFVLVSAASGALLAVLLLTAPALAPAAASGWAAWAASAGYRVLPRLLVPS